jgi:peptidoglycan hydrolase CwlO-like protein
LSFSLKKVIFKFSQEQKYEAEQSLKKCKQNEQLLNGEIEYLRKQLDKFTSNEMPDKEKDIKVLNLKIKEVMNQY